MPFSVLNVDNCLLEKLLRKNKIFFLVNEIVVTEYEKEGAITNNLLSRYNISAKVFLE